LCQSLAHPPTPRNIESWIQGDHYPTAAFVARAEGRTAFILTVQPDGRPSACRITESSGNADLDEATCELFRKGRFNPAVDDKGAKVAGKWASAMRWELPH
jgi:protein TonB